MIIKNEKDHIDDIFDSSPFQKTHSSIAIEVSDNEDEKEKKYFKVYLFFRIILIFYRIGEILPY